MKTKYEAMLSLAFVILLFTMFLLLVGCGKIPLAEERESLTDTWTRSYFYEGRSYVDRIIFYDNETFRRSVMLHGEMVGNWAGLWELEHDTIWFTVVEIDGEYIEPRYYGWIYRLSTVLLVRDVREEEWVTYERGG